MEHPKKTSPRVYSAPEPGRQSRARWEEKGIASGRNRVNAGVKGRERGRDSGLRRFWSERGQGGGAGPGGCGAHSVPGSRVPGEEQGEEMTCSAELGLGHLW